MPDAEFASPREEVAAIGEKGADTELAVNNYLELKRIRIARTKAEGRSDGIENNAMVSMPSLHDSGDLTARVSDVKLIGKYRSGTDTKSSIPLRATSPSTTSRGRTRGLRITPISIPSEDLRGQTWERSYCTPRESANPMITHGSRRVRECT